jgi:hypothetical protein
MATPPDFTAGQILTAAQMNEVGLWLVKTQSVTAGSGTTTVSDVFSADFNNYRVLISNYETSLSADLRFQFNGITTTVYNFGVFTAVFGSTTNLSANNQTFFLIGQSGNDTGNSVSVDFHGPFTTTRKNYTGTFIGQNNSGFVGGQCTNTASSTGFALTLSTGTFTSGTIRVYGYRN